MNNDDENSKLLETELFQGEIVTVGIHNHAEYMASNVQYLAEGMGFEVRLSNEIGHFFIPTFGKHNIYNALFAIAICHRLGFTISDIRLGLANYQKPIKRLNLFTLNDESVLIDDTANANPQSVKAAVDVLLQIGKNKKKIIVLGSMLELGDYTVQGHTEVGDYLAKHQVDAIFTYGDEAKCICKAARNGGYPEEKIQHFTKRLLLHRALKGCMKPNSVILVKGSSSTKMSRTVEYILDTFVSTPIAENNQTTNFQKQSIYNIVFDKNIDTNTISLSNQTLKLMNVNTSHINLCFGTFIKKLTIQIENNLEKGKVVLSPKLTAEMSIPDLPYHYYFNSNNLFLGPFIGFLILDRYYQDPKRQLLRFANYDKIKGLIVLFKRNTIDRYNKTIKGYYYDPQTQDFILGTFPYPTVIYNRTPVSQSMYEHLTKHIGKNLFNYPYGNRSKWTFWKRMCKRPALKEHLPMTKRYKDANSLVEMLDQYEGVYLKPTKLAGGAGIYFVQKSQQGYLLTDSQGQRSIINKDDLAKTLRRKLRKKATYIVQQEIPFNQLGNKIDFRVYLQKDITKEWKFRGMETKVSIKGSIISNSKNREKIMPGETALQEIYHLNESQTEQKVQEITKLCIEALKTMESYGEHLGDAAFDLVIDKEHKVWLLELQLNYAAEIKANRKEDERRVLPNILPTPFEYAKALTGFNFI